MTKKIVHYRRNSVLSQPFISGHIYLQTLDHPGPHVTNWPEGDGFVLTSRIVAIGENGEFETENTHYVPNDI